MPRGTARRAPAALPLRSLSPTPSRPRDLVAAAVAAKERDAEGRTEPEGLRPVPASGAAALATTAIVVSILATSPVQSTRPFGLGL